VTRSRKCSKDSAGIIVFLQFAAVAYGKHTFHSAVSDPERMVVLSSHGKAVTVFRSSEDTAHFDVEYTSEANNNQRLLSTSKRSSRARRNSGARVGLHISLQSWRLFIFLCSPAPTSRSKLETQASSRA
jgi:hypothetical protein